MSALPGEHYCENHQGNHSHYANTNCTVCKLEQQLTELTSSLDAQLKQAMGIVRERVSGQIIATPQPVKE